MSRTVRTIHCRNVNEALYLGTELLRNHGVEVSPRGLKTLEAPGPVITTYSHPEECVLFSKARKINPFFHLFEALWVLVGRDDVETLAKFNSRMREYSDNGRTFHAPYGYRLQQHFGKTNFFNGINQLRACADILEADPESRQAVASIWDPEKDLPRTGYSRTKDTPCNDTLAFKIRDGAVHLTVFCRSNDMLWGAYGTNAVQFSVILQYMAHLLGCKVGSYTQISDSFHVYTENDNAPNIREMWEKVQEEADKRTYVLNDYELKKVEMVPMFGGHRTLEFDVFVTDLLCGDVHSYPNKFDSPFLEFVAKPMLIAWNAWKIQHDAKYARAILSDGERCTVRDHWVTAARNFIPTEG